MPKTQRLPTIASATPGPSPSPSSPCPWQSLPIQQPERTVSPSQTTLWLTSISAVSGLMKNEHHLHLRTFIFAFFPFVYTSLSPRWLFPRFTGFLAVFQHVDRPLLVYLPWMLRHPQNLFPCFIQNLLKYVPHEDFPDPMPCFFLLCDTHSSLNMLHHLVISKVALKHQIHKGVICVYVLIDVSPTTLGLMCSGCFINICYISELMGFFLHNFPYVDGRVLLFEKIG